MMAEIGYRPGKGFPSKEQKKKNKNTVLGSKSVRSHRTFWIYSLEFCILGFINIEAQVI